MIFLFSLTDSLHCQKCRPGTESFPSHNLCPYSWAPNFCGNPGQEIYSPQIMDHLKGINLPSISRLRTFSTPTRLTVMGVSVGIGLIALLAVFFRRKRGPRTIEKKTGSFRERQTYKTPLALSPNGGKRVYLVAD